MKTKLRIAAVAVVISSAVAVPAFAQASTPGIDQRQANQEQRIDQGVASGQLNARETARLERGQQRVEQYGEPGQV